MRPIFLFDKNSLNSSSSDTSSRTASQPTNFSSGQSSVIHQDAREMEIFLYSKIAIHVLMTFVYSILLYLFLEVPDLFYIKNIVASLGGGSAIFHIFLSKTVLSRITTLYSFCLSSYLLFFFQGFFLDLDLAILGMILISGSFFVSFYFSSRANSDPFFMGILFVFLILIGPQWALSFILEFIILFIFKFIKSKKVEKNNIFVSFCLLLPLSLYFKYLEVNQTFSILEVSVLAAAGAGGLQFLCLTQLEQLSGFLLFFGSNLLLCFVQNEIQTFPKITVVFFLTILSFFVFFLLVSLYKEEKLSSVVSESKITLRAVFFPILSALDEVFFNSRYLLWIGAFMIHVIVLLVLKFIFNKEKEQEE